MFVRLSVRSHAANLTKCFVHMLPVAVAQACYCDGVAIRYFRFYGWHHIFMQWEL